MAQTREGRSTYVGKTLRSGSRIVRTISTPAGDFRLLRQDVLDRAKRSANTALQELSTSRGPSDGRNE